MSQVSSVRVRFEDLRSLGFAGIGAAYAAVGTPLTHPIRILKIVNLSDIDLLVSFNGIDDKDIVPTKGFVLYDLSTNKSDTGGYFEVPVGDRVYVKQEAAVAATAGSVYVTAIYASHV